MDFFATCAHGLESMLAEELDGLGAADLSAGDGIVTFSGELKDAYRACLWSRLAERIAVVLAEGPVDGADSLQALARTVAWEKALVRDASLEVYTSGYAPRLTRSSFVSRKVQEAITAYLLEHAGAVPPSDGSLTFRVQIHLSDEPADLDESKVDDDDSTPDGGGNEAASTSGDADSGNAKDARAANDSGSDDSTTAESAPRQAAIGHALIGVDLAGEPLWKRSYERIEKRGLPNLRPDYAAAALIAGGWPELVESCVGVAPTLTVMFSGGATLIGEAAGMVRDVAPGLLRARWGFEAWLGHRPQSWTALVNGAKRRRKLAEGLKAHFIGADPRPGARAYPGSILRAMGVDLPSTYVTGRSLAKAGESIKGPALVAADLSWVAAGDETAEARSLAELSTFCLGLPAGQRAVVLAPKDLGELPFGDPAPDSPGLTLTRSKVQTSIDTYRDLALKGTEARIGGSGTLVLDPATSDFVHRLTDRAATEAIQAEEEDVHCYRVYDRDHPEYPFAIDLYVGAAKTPGRWLVIQEFQAPEGEDPDQARRRLLDVMNAAPRVLDVDPTAVELKRRVRAKGGSQYASGDAPTPRSRRKPRMLYGAPLPAGSALVEEGGLLFEVDLAAHLDTGIFLDTRDVRARIRELAKQAKGRKRFLNLFAYTGTATCYAADGGCPETTTVDLSGPYLDVARRNLARNGFLKAPEPADVTGTAIPAHAPAPGKRPPRQPHEFIRADAMRWIAEQRQGRKRWDLIYCDPPTFSNSKSMKKSFDVQRDHLDLMIGVSRLLAQGGVAVFCCNLSTFEPDLERLSRAGVVVKDITDETIPFDFQGGPLPHHCYLLSRTPKRP